MVDWQAVAVFLAAGTWLVTTLLDRPLTWFRNWASWILLERSYQCQAICWTHLPPKLSSRRTTAATVATDTIVWSNDSDGKPNLERILATKAFLGVLEVVFATRPTTSKRPRYLEEKKKYIRTDGDTLLAFIVSSAQYGNLSLAGSDNLNSVLTFRVGSVSGSFHQYQDSGETYIVGSLLQDAMVNKLEIRPGIYGLPKEVLRRIADGYPPFYRDQITTRSGVRIAHKIKSIRGACRGGWIITAGLSIHEPFMKYNGAYEREYRKACCSVQKTIEKAIRPAFSDSMQASDSCDIAIRVISRMNSNESGSGLETFLVGTSFQGCTNHNARGDTLRADQCHFAIRIFDENREEPVIGDDKTEIEEILLPVLRAAIHGVFRWWQYRNNEGGQLPKWLLDERCRYTPIWIEA